MTVTIVMVIVKVMPVRTWKNGRKVMTEKNNDESDDIDVKT